MPIDPIDAAFLIVVLLIAIFVLRRLLAARGQAKGEDVDRRHRSDPPQLGRPPDPLRSRSPLPATDDELLDGVGPASSAIWIKNSKDAQDLPKLLGEAMNLVARGKLPQEVYSDVMQRRFTVVPNTSDDRGGYFVVFCRITPSWKKRWWQF